MPDHFAALDLPRRPWLEATALKERFHRLSATLHPDVAGSGDAAGFGAANAAYAVLRDPAGRLRHLLELEAPDLAAASATPPALAEIFMRQAGFQQRLTAHTAKRNAAGHPLARALLASEAVALRREGEQLQADLEQTHAAALDAVRTLDAVWADAPDYPELSALQRQLAFLGKWRAQLREALFQLEA